MSRITLNSGWMVRYEELSCGPEINMIVQDRREGWMDADLPCDIHMPLIESGIIKEPLVGNNYKGCEWIEEKSWWFKKVFNIDSEFLENDCIELNMDSLDSEADIFLNGAPLGHHKSSFYPYKKEIGKLLKKGENVLLVRLSTGVEYFSERDISQIKRYISTERCDNRGDKRRVFVRKPQYVFGWDWGPRLVTCGIMGAVWLESFNKFAIRSVYAFTKSISEDAEISFEIEIENLHPFSTAECNMNIEMTYGEEVIWVMNQEVFLRSGLNFVNFIAVIKNARLWWPNGMGGQPLYDVRVSVVSGRYRNEYPVFKLGIRTIRLINEKISKSERNFAFEINGVRCFSKGADWIPADSIYARVTQEKYRLLLEEAREANFNMLRVWGGGLYEREVFYEKCDEHGIMIWQDFMFACAFYPDNLEWFLKEVANEMEYQTRRLRNHPSVVIWCGNNENHWAFDEWYPDEKILFYGGAEIYNRLAPGIVHKNCEHIPYWNSTPYGGEHPNSSDMGVRHLWPDFYMNPEMEKRITPEEYDRVTAKFVVEYGYIGPCKKSSIMKFHNGSPIDRNGYIWKLHNNTFEKDTVVAGIAKHYCKPEELCIDDYLLYAGLCQGIMLGYSLEAIRFKENCYGSLIWMYSDCWGEVGWSVIDYYKTRKISFYFVKRAFEPVKFILRENAGIVGVFGINDSSSRLDIALEYGYMGFCGENRECKTIKIKLLPYSRNIILEFEKGRYDFKQGFCYVKPVSDSINIKPAVLRQQSFKELRIPEAWLEVESFAYSGDSIKLTIKSNFYAHAVHFNLDDEFRLSDEYFDLLPEESRDITIYHAAGRLCADDIKPVCVTHI